MEDKKMKFVVGSKSPIKIGAVKEALWRFGITNAEVVSRVTNIPSVDNQPIGLNMITLGAQSRAYYCRSYHMGGPYIAIGIENGLLEDRNPTKKYLIDFETSDIAVCSVISPRNEEYTSVSQGVIFPQKYVEMSRKIDFTKTAASFLAEEYPECDPKDPHSFLTNGRFSRQRILADCLEGIFATMPEFYMRERLTKSNSRKLRDIRDIDLRMDKLKNDFLEKMCELREAINRAEQEHVKESMKITDPLLRKSCLEN